MRRETFGREEGPDLLLDIGAAAKACGIGDRSDRSTARAELLVSNFLIAVK
ncbi:hypothetical protein [Gemmobacter caeni]|uniref:hypothetical protein n=1 Tax=Gemmobacter caeni TaxID=589035 RepID=UPI001FD53D2D|nr:hypothetical protein [Gemmobacter caeni]